MLNVLFDHFSDQAAQDVHDYCEAEASGYQDEQADQVYGSCVADFVAAHEAWGVEPEDLFDDEG